MKRRSILEQLAIAARLQRTDSAPSLPHNLARHVTPERGDFVHPQSQPEFAAPEDRGLEGAIAVQVTYAWTTRLLVHTLGRADEMRQYESPEAGPPEARWCRTVIPDWGSVPDHCTCQAYMLSRA